LTNVVVSSPGVSTAKWSIDIPTARSSASACSPCNIDESSSECEIEEHSKSAQECDSSKTAHEHECEDGVEDTGAGNAFHGAYVGVDVEIMIGECCEEVGEDSEDDGCAAEFDEPEKEARRLQSDTSESHLGV
jgi:hypothetical protein